MQSCAELRNRSETSTREQTDRGMIMQARWRPAFQRADLSHVSREAPPSSRTAFAYSTLASNLQIRFPPVRFKFQVSNRRPCGEHRETALERCSVSRPFRPLGPSRSLLSATTTAQHTPFRPRAPRTAPDPLLVIRITPRRHRGPPPPPPQGPALPRDFTAC